MQRSLVQRMGGRRWLAAIGLTAISTWLTHQRIMTGDAWALFQNFLYGTMVVGNVSQRAVEAARSVKMPQGKQPAEASE